MSASSNDTRHLSLRPPLYAVLIVLGLALLARGLMLYSRLVIEGYPPENLIGSDVPGWLGAAVHLYRKRDLSYWLMGARPPLYPLSVAAVYALGGNNYHAAVLQALFGTLASVLGYVMAHRLLCRVKGMPRPERFALLAGIIMALDPASVSASTTLLSDPLYNLMFAACLLSLTAYIQEERPLDLAFSALWLALTMLTRPTAIYFWLAVPLITIPLMRRWWRPVVTLAAVGLAVYLGWSYRNLRYEGVFTYSMQANFSLLFLRAISAEHLATRAPMDELYTDYVRELYLSVGDVEAAENTVAEHFWKFLVADTPELYAAMGRLAFQKLARYWPYALLGTPIGVARLFGLTLHLPRWSIPFELAYHVLLYGMALGGAWQAFKRKDWELLAVVGIPLLYITGLTLTSQTSAMDTRMRTPITAQIVIFATYGLARMLEMWRARRAARHAEAA
jgi:hypothetical protein